MPNSIMYGPSDMGGIELHLLYVEQGAAQLQYLLCSPAPVLTLIPMHLGAT